METQEYMITTVDNPFSPFDDFDKWFEYDVLHHHNTCQLLASFSTINETMSTKERLDAVEQAIDEVIRLDFQHKFKKISRPYKPEFGKDQHLNLDITETDRKLFSRRH